jgi:mRNA interferase MazF
VIVTAQRILDASPSVIHVVPLTSVVRGFGSEVSIEPDDQNALGEVSAAQCQHIRAISTDRLEEVIGNVGPLVLSQIRETIGLILDLPA